MKIERLELYGYVRLMLANIQRFVYTPSAHCQIILGTNGSGKSSILYELSPLPAQSGQYAKGGYKRVLITHKGCEYLLESSFAHGNKHSFKKDGEELNPGGTGSVQKELVKREFGYTFELHQLLIGRTRFTELAPMKRREWITLMDSVDYTYPLGVYQKLKSTARDHQGTLKHLKQRLLSETNNLRALADTEGMEERAHQLHHELNALLANRLPNLPSLEQTQQQLVSLMNRIEQLGTTVVTQKVPVPKGKTYGSLADVNEDVQRLDMLLNTQQTVLHRTTSEYTELESVVENFTQNGEITVENVEGHILECESQLEDLKLQVAFFMDIPDAEQVQRDTAAILDEVSSLFGIMPDNSDRRFTVETKEQAKVRIKENETIIDRSAAKMSAINARLQVIHSAKDTNCPSCGYVWREGFSEQEVEQNEQWLSEHQAIIDEAKRRIEVDLKFLEEAEHLTGLYNQFRGFVSGYPRMKPLWDHILQNNLLLDRPAEQRLVFSTWYQDVQLHAKRAELQRKLAHLMELEQRQKQLGGAGHLVTRLSTLMVEIEEMTQALTELRQSTRDVRQYRDRMARVAEAAASLEALVGDLERTQRTAVDAMRNRHIDQLVHQHQHELAEINRRLTDKRSLEGIVQDLTTSHEEVDLDHQVYALLAKALSPDEGLIAEQLSGFIGCLVAQLNSIIASVWAYDLKVLACGLDSGELDYKFPLQAKDQESADISESSKGQAAMVDFAFQLTAMLYMGLEDYPLFLDEPGEGFDEQHRVNLMNFIKQLIDSGRYSQTFMISHFATSHGAFVSAEVLVLEGTNIAVPSHHNNHVVME